MTKAFLTHPVTVIVSMMVGAGFGYWLPEQARSLGDFGDIYLSALQMCVLPLVAVAVFTSCISVGSQKENMLGLLKGIVIWFAGGMFVVVLMGMAIGMMTSLGNEIDGASQKILGGFVNLAESPGNKMVIRNGFDFLQLIIPHNPFLAFVEGSGLKILFFSIVMGAAFSLGNHERVKLVTDVLGDVFDAFIRVMNFLMLLLPFGLFFMFAKQFSGMTFDVLSALGKLIVVCTIAVCSLILANVIMIKMSSGRSFWYTCKALSGILIMSFATQSGFITMPRMIRDLKSHFQLDEKLLKVIIPLGVNMSPQGTCVAIAIFGVFFANMYEVALTPAVLMVLVVGTMMISMAISGMPAIVGISMIAGLFETLSVPTAVSTIILMAVFPILDPFITALNCIGNCNYSTALGRDKSMLFNAKPAIASGKVLAQ